MQHRFAPLPLSGEGAGGEGEGRTSYIGACSISRPLSPEPTGNKPVALSRRESGDKTSLTLHAKSKSKHNA